MIKSIIKELAGFGQSIWLDNINRSLIEEGKLKEMVDFGLRGITSNPSIFDKAISSSNDYDKKIAKLLNIEKTTFEIYDDLTVEDVQEAADMLKIIYDKTNGFDGYVSLEVNPKLAFKINETIEEAKRLHEKVNRSNVMLKIPSTNEGFKAIEELIAIGININATLIFSLDQYINTARAYIRGLKRLSDNKGNISRTHSVASVFVSRVDTLIDSLLDDMVTKETDKTKLEKLKFLKGKAAVSNSNIIYGKYLDIFNLDEFLKLKDKGANVQRVLWASTSTKNPDYDDIKYITELIAKNTVNTVPGNTLEAFLGHGFIKENLTSDVRGANNIIDSLRNVGIDINQICDKLLQDGVVAFENSFNSLLGNIEKKAKNILAV